MSIYQEYKKAKKISNFSRPKLLELQKQRYRETLQFTYNNSPFYKKLWESAGINKDNLLTTTLDKFPIVNKKIIMDNLGEIFTQQGIVKEDLEKFIESDSAGKSLFQNKYVVLNTSGSSGLSGIFLFDSDFWNILVATLSARLIPLSMFKLLFRKTRIAFLGETSGHHSGISIVRSAPDFFTPLSLSITTPKETLVEALNKFKPHVLSGYASALESLAQEKLLKKLKISPEIIISSGEPLTPLRQKNIQNAFKISAFDFYGATECLAIGVDNNGSGTLNIFDDLILLETLDENNQPVPQGQLGKIVITVLGNKIQPLVRYALDDEIIIKPNSPKSPFTQAERVLGRNMDNLTFTVEGKKIEVPPMELVGFFLQGLKQYQIIQTSPTSMKVKIVVDGNVEGIKQKANEIIMQMLKENSLPDNSIKLELEFVSTIPPSAKTGKTPMVISLQKYLEDQQIQVQPAEQTTVQPSNQQTVEQNLVQSTTQSSPTTTQSPRNIPVMNQQQDSPAPSIIQKEIDSIGVISSTKTKKKPKQKKKVKIKKSKAVKKKSSKSSKKSSKKSVKKAVKKATKKLVHKPSKRLVKKPVKKQVKKSKKKK